MEEGIWFWYRNRLHKLTYIHLFTPYLLFSYTFPLFPVDAYTFQSLKRECYISEHVIYLYYLLIFPCLFCHLHHLLHLPEPFFYVGLDLGSARFCSSCTVFLYIFVLRLSKVVQMVLCGPTCCNVYICLDLGSARFCSSCTVFLYILVLKLSKVVQSSPNGPKCYKLVQNLKRLKKRTFVGLQFLFDVFTM